MSEPIKVEHAVEAGKVEHADVVEHTDHLSSVTMAAPPPTWTRWVKDIGTVIAAVLAATSMLIAILYLAPTVSKLADQSSDAVEDRREIEEELAAARAVGATALKVEACRNLYEQDILVVRAARDIEEGRLFSTVVQIPPTTPTEERDRIVSQAVADLAAKDAALGAAVDAFTTYVESDPPPGVCPHP